MVETKFKKTSRHQTKVKRRRKGKIDEDYIKARTNENSLIISGLPLNTTSKSRIKQQLEKFFADELGITTTIVNSTKLRKAAYVVDVGNFTDKIKIMNCDSLPRQTGNEVVYIYAGLTEQERKVDEALAEEARKELAEGNAVKVGYRKLWINGWEWKWDEEKERLVKALREPGKNEVLISGYRASYYDNNESLTRKLKRLIKRDLGIDVAINNVSQLRRDLIMVELGSPEDKAEILSKSLNYKLLEKGIEFCYSTSQVPTDQEMQKKFTDKQEKFKNLTAEMAAELRERHARKNNIVITGLQLLATNEKQLKGAVEDFLATEVEVPTKAMNVTQVGEDVYLVTVANFADKISILKNIYKMVDKKTNVKIFPDLTLGERRIHQKIMARAQQEMDRGNHAKVGHMRLYINRQMYVWDETKDDLVPDTRGQKADKAYNKVKAEQRKQLKKSLIVKGLYTRSNKGIHLARELEEFFANELDVYATVSNATKLRASMIVVEIDDINDKKSILRNRRMVAHRGVTIYLAQLSKAPRDIQMEIARRADEERAKGNFVKLGRFELFINNTRFHWDDEKGKLVKRVQLNRADQRRAQMRENYERFRRRNNVIVSRMAVQSANLDKLKEIFAKFFEEQLNVRVTVVNVKKIKSDSHVVELSSFAEKSAILTEKYQLRERGMQVMIFPDRTTAERRRKFEISKFAAEQEKLGKDVQFATKGLYVDGEKWVWSEQEDGLVQLSTITRNNPYEKTKENEKLDKLAKKFKRNNRFIINGLFPRTKEPRLVMQTIQKFLWIQMEVNVSVVNVSRIKEGMFLVELSSFREKVDVMEAKFMLKNLRDRFIYIEQEPSPYEDAVHDKISLMAEFERRNGNRVHIGYLRMFIDGVEWFWDDKIQNVVTHEGLIDMNGEMTPERQEVPKKFHRRRKQFSDSRPESDYFYR